MTGKDFVEDGFGNAWRRCDFKDCDLHVVRPGKAQCSNCDVRSLRAERDMLREALRAFATHVDFARKHSLGPVIVRYDSEAVKLLDKLIEFGMLLPAQDAETQTPTSKVITDSEPEQGPVASLDSRQW